MIYFIRNNLYKMCIREIIIFISNSRLRKFLYK